MEMGANGARVWARAGRALKVRRERVRERRIRPATVARIGTREGGRARHGVQGWPARGVDEAVRGRGMGAACGERGWPTGSSRIAGGEADAWHAAMRAPVGVVTSSIICKPVSLLPPHQ